MTKLVSIQIIPAQPNTYEVYSDDKNGLCLGDLIIAYRIETEEIGNKQPPEYSSYLAPLTVSGDVCSNCIGTQQSDGSVTIHSDCTYKSLALAQADWQSEDA